MSAFDGVPGQSGAISFLIRAAERPHHAYVLGGPEGSGKSLAARAFAAALVCRTRGCGECRDCRLALSDRHPNVFVVEPEGRDIHVDTVRDEIWQPAYRTAPEPGRKVFMIREADRLSPAAADTLLKVLEEPPPDTVFLLLSARAHELPETVMSRCHVVAFAALPERLVVEQLVSEGVDEPLARLSSILAGGNLGRARRIAAEGGLVWRDTAQEAIALAGGGPAGALQAADLVLAAAADYKKGLRAELEQELAPFLDEKGRPEDAYRGAIRRIELRAQRRERRAERDHVDRVLFGATSLLRDRVAVTVGAASLMNEDRSHERVEVARAAAAISGLEAARAALAEDMNLNARLVLEGGFLHMAVEPGYHSP
jgi:DNA polymerase-3 subunit delta'